MGSRRALEKAKATPENLLEAVKEIMKKESQETANEASKQRSRNIYHHRSVKSHQPKKQSIQQPIHFVQIESTH